MATITFKHFTVQNTAGIIIPELFKGRKNMGNVCRKYCKRLIEY